MSSPLLTAEDVAAARRQLNETTFPYPVCRTLQCALDTIDQLHADNAVLRGPDLDQLKKNAALGAAVLEALKALAGDCPSLWLEVAIQQEKRLKRKYVGMLLAAISDALPAE